MNRLKLEPNEPTRAEYDAGRADQPTVQEVGSRDPHLTVFDAEVAHARIAISAKAHRHHRLSGIVAGALSAFTVVFTVGVQLLIRQYGENLFFWQRVFPALTATNLIFLSLTAAWLIRMKMKTGRQVRGHAAVLCREETKESIGALIDLFKFDDLDSHRAAKQSLTRLLPTLRASDARLLSSKHRAALNRMLASPPADVGRKDLREIFVDTTKREVQFRVAILEAYQQVGDVDALPIVQHLANAVNVPDSHRPIKDAAMECLPYLKVRVEQQSAHNSLLRGASLAPPSGDNLLRAAASTSTAKSGELLRPEAAP